MSLTSALSIAQNALLNTSRQTSVVSRNVSEANNPDYSRRSAVLVSTANGARVAQIQRATSDVLLRQNLSALSGLSAQQTLLDSANQLSLSVNGTDNASSPATWLGKFQQALQVYSASPSNSTLAENAVEAARQMVQVLNNGTSQIQSFRADVDTQLGTAVGELNTLLSDFEQLNRDIVAGTRQGRDVNDALDKRDALLKKISEYVPVSVVARENNDMALVTSSGAMLFDTIARPVTFERIIAYTPGTTGNAVLVDGVPLVAGSGGNTTASGKIAAFMQARDTVAAGMQAQLDEIARVLVTTFAESDVNGVLPDQAGLFTWSGGPNVPAGGTLVNGIAGQIRINAAYDSRQGGNPSLLRDGGANGVDYKANVDGNSGFSTQLLKFLDALDEPVAFDAAAGLPGSASLTNYTASSISWIEAIRQNASGAADTKSALYMRTEAALSNATGVNIDEEMSILLDLEHSYEASARILAAIDAMFGKLLEAVR